MDSLTLHGQIRRERFARHTTDLFLGSARALWRGILSMGKAAASASEARVQLRLRVAGETAEARALATRVEGHDPGFAADLRAAVLRHEATALGFEKVGVPRGPWERP
jgi:hypothetical protein